MKQYINKSALVAEIERRIKVLQKHPYESHVTICHLDSLKQSLDTLEVKEVDINNEISQFIDANFEKATIGHKLSLRRIARHFFELGLGVQLPVFIYKPLPQNLASELGLKTQKGGKV